MSLKRTQHTKQIKLNAVNYSKEYPNLTHAQATKNLGIDISTLAHH